MSAFVDAYAELGVRPDASAAELKAAHRRLVRLHHPDLKPPDQRSDATRRVQRINVAYGLVRDPQARAAYDRARRAHLLAERASSAGQQAADRIREADRLAAARWDELVSAAGRWAGVWWRRNRGRAARAGRRLRVDLVGRVLWLGSLVGWALLGLALTAVGQRLAGIDGTLGPAVGILAGAWLGSQRGWRRRLRMAGLPATGAPALEVALATVAVIAAVLVGRT